MRMIEHTETGEIQCVESLDGYSDGWIDRGEVPAGVPPHEAQWDGTAITCDLSACRASLRAAVCARAEAVRGQFITPGAGQALTYARKEIEARAWITGSDPASSPFLAAEAAAVDMSIDALAQLVIAQADAWIEAGSAIEARRRGLLVAIEEAGSRAALDAIDIATGWPEVSE